MAKNRNSWYLTCCPGSFTSLPPCFEGANRKYGYLKRKDEQRQEKETLQNKAFEVWEKIDCRCLCQNLRRKCLQPAPCTPNWCQQHRLISCWCYIQEEKQQLKIEVLHKSALSNRPFKNKVCRQSLASRCRFGKYVVFTFLPSYRRRAMPASCWLA